MPIRRINQNWVKCDGCGIEHYDPAVIISEQLRIEKLNHWTGNKDEIYCPECSRKIAEAKAKAKAKAKK